jgi:hypothetical protein
MPKATNSHMANNEQVDDFERGGLNFCYAHHATTSWVSLPLFVHAL